MRIRSLIEPQLDYLSPKLMILKFTTTEFTYENFCEVFESVFTITDYSGNIIMTPSQFRRDPYVNNGCIAMTSSQVRRDPYIYKPGYKLPYLYPQPELYNYVRVLEAPDILFNINTLDHDLVRESYDKLIAAGIDKFCISQSNTLYFVCTLSYNLHSICNPFRPAPTFPLMGHPTATVTEYNFPYVNIYLDKIVSTVDQPIPLDRFEQFLSIFELLGLMGHSMLFKIVTISLHYDTIDPITMKPLHHITHLDLPNIRQAHLNLDNDKFKFTLVDCIEDLQEGLKEGNELFIIWRRVNRYLYINGHKGGFSALTITFRRV